MLTLVFWNAIPPQPHGENFMAVEGMIFMGPAIPERAHFRVSPEMLEIMGGSVDAEPFKYFGNLVIRCTDSSR